MIPAPLLAAYVATRYVVADEAGGAVVLIGEASTAVDQLLRTYRVAGGAIVTAWNPLSRPCKRSFNRSANVALEKQARAAGWACLPVTAQAPDPAWTEEGFLVLGCDEAAARALGRSYRQNAIVMVELGTAARLVDLTGS